MGDLILNFWFELGNERVILLGFVDIMPFGYTIFVIESSNGFVFSTFPLIPCNREIYCRLRFSPLL